MVQGRAEVQSTSLEDQFAELEDHSHDTEIEARLAALKISPRSGTVRWYVLLKIIEAGDRGITDDELSRSLGRSPNTIRPRRVELVEGDWITEGEFPGVSAYGNKAICWVANPKALALVDP